MVIAALKIFYKKQKPKIIHYRNYKTLDSNLKKRLRHWCFPVNFAKVVSATFLQNNSGRLVLPKTDTVL